MFLSRITLIVVIFSLLLFSCNNEKAELLRLTEQVMQKNKRIVEEGNNDLYKWIQEIYFEEPIKAELYLRKLNKLAIFADSIHSLIEVALSNGSIGNAKKQEFLNSVLDFQNVVLIECFPGRYRDQYQFDTLNIELFNLEDNLFIDVVGFYISQIKSEGYRAILSSIDASCFKFDIVEAQIIPRSKQALINSPLNFHVVLATSKGLQKAVKVHTHLYKDGALLDSDTITSKITEKAYPHLRDYGLKYNYTPADSGNYLLKATLLLHYFDTIVEFYATEEVKFLVK